MVLMSMNDKEIWKDIYYIENNKLFDYSGLYQVSNLGRIKSLNYRNSKKEKILKQANDKNGYKIVCLSKNNIHKNFKVHRLVAHMFIKNDDPLNKTQVNHINEFEKYNNSVKNLEWCTAKYNANYGTAHERAVKKAKETLKNKDLNGENNPFYGKCHNEETKRIVSEKNSKPILQYDKDGNLIREWKSARKISEELQINYSHVSSCCIFYEKGKDWWNENRKSRPIKSYKGFVWKFKNVID